MRFLLIWSLLLSLALQGQSATDTTLTYRSAVLKEDRKISVHLPASYGASEAARYPVLYLLDSEINNAWVTAVTDFLARRPYPKLPEVIVVGIHNTARTRDFTPSHSTEPDPRTPGRFLFADSGGAENFLHFLSKELKPFIKARYRTSSREVLMGHSFGGLLTLTCLLRYPEEFSGYIANDPSLWWDDEFLVKEFLKLPENTLSLRQRRLYLSEAAPEAGATGWKLRHPGAIANFNTAIRRLRSGPDYQYGYFDAENHGTVSLAAALKALPWIFSEE